MRNVFDQYSQPENQLTHALVCTLNADRELLVPFLRWCGCSDIPKAKLLHITEQQVPGERLSGDENEKKGLPDGCVFTDHGWAFLIEAKVQAGISVKQLNRHIATAKRHGFENPKLLLLSVDMPPKSVPLNTTCRTWREVYTWFRKFTESNQAKVFTQYMEVFESRMIRNNYSIRGTITMFDGFKFDENTPYTYNEGKRLIRLIGDDLQKRNDLKKIGIDPSGNRRTAITGKKESRVWDFVPLKIAKDSSSFTDFPHLTMVIKQEYAVAAVTIPHGVKGGFRTSLNKLGLEGFLDLLLGIEADLRPVLNLSIGSVANVYATQRNYPSQSSDPIIDAKLEADLQTIVPGKRRSAKYQPEWVEAIYNVVTRKKSNIQLGIEVRFLYGCPLLGSPKATELFAKSWIAMNPLVQFALKSE
ncbi:MAG: hypothetical protein P1U42_11845 [Phycisphaerales bacterium]|nr:hypothetical protein [Phycisphaerales bacterium]